MAEMRAGVSGEMTELRAGVSGEMAELRAGVSGEMAELRGEQGSLRGEMLLGFAELKASHAAGPADALLRKPGEHGEDSRAQMGRARCRESVWKDVCITVGGVAVKTKKVNT